MVFKRIMIIVWKWSYLNGQLQDEFPIRKSPTDLIIRISDKDDSAKHRIIAAIEKYTNADIFIFLHRGEEHFFNQSDIEEILRESGNISNCLIKCFLFGGGSDFIYYDFKKCGILNESGGFQDEPEYAYIIEDERIAYREVSVLHKGKEVKKKFFDFVWKHYKHEFEKKIRALKIDLLRYFVSLEHPDKNYTKQQDNFWAAKLQENDLLRLRLFSFLNYYDRKELEKLEPLEQARRNEELDALLHYEDTYKRSYIFDDCTVNLGEMFSQENSYFRLCSKLRPIFIDDLKPQNNNISLLEIKKLFDDVLIQINAYQTLSQ